MGGCVFRGWLVGVAVAGYIRGQLPPPCRLLCRRPCAFRWMLSASPYPSRFFFSWYHRQPTIVCSHVLRDWVRGDWGELRCIRVQKEMVESIEWMGQCMGLAC